MLKSQAEVRPMVRAQLGSPITPTTGEGGEGGGGGKGRGDHDRGGGGGVEQRCTMYRFPESET